MQLRKMVEQLTTESRQAHDELAALDGLRDQLVASVPDFDTVLELALQRERAVQDARNAKVLQLLEAKVIRLH